MKQLIFVVLFMCSLGLASQNMKTHRVKSGETIEDIAKIYLVTPFDIYALNPDAKSGIETDMVLVIPNSRVKNDPVTEETKEIIGYRTHKAKRKETLFSISKEYGISVDELKKYNTFLYAENLKRGDKLRIPRYKTIINKVSYENTLKTYKVQPSEGKWRVAYKFGMTVTELENLNPDIKEVLQPGDILNVPNIANNEENIISDTYSYYEVQPKEGFYRLQVKLGLSQSELEQLNPQLKDEGLKAGMILRVPRDEDPVLLDNDTTPKELSTNLINFNTRRLAVLLPFQLHKIDLDSVGETKELIKTNRLLSITLDFHSGVLMALDSAKQLGINAKIDVYDTENQLVEVSTLLKNTDFSQYDAVIGPLTTKNVDRVAEEIRGDSVPIISPLSNPSRLYFNTFQTLATEEYLKDRMIDFVKRDSLKNKVLIIADQNHRTRSNEIKSIFPTAKQIFSKLNKDEKDGYFILPKDLEEVFIKGKNVVFLETDNSAFASSVISMLNGLRLEDIEIVLTTTNKNRAFETKNIDNNNLSNLKFQYASVNKYVNSETNNGFIADYKKMYGVAPSKYAVRGFDITLDVLIRLASTYGSFYEMVKQGLETEHIENKFNYIQSLYGGYVNQTAYILRYENLEIITLE